MSAQDSNVENSRPETRRRNLPLELRLARRNVWRTPRRTILTVTATVFAVVLVVFFVAMAAGLHGKMIEDSVRLGSGHLTLTGKGYLEERTLEQFLILNAPLANLLDKMPGIAGYAPRVSAFGLLSKDEDTRGVLVMGVDPRREPSVSSLPDRVWRGRFLRADDRWEIVLGERLAQVLSARVGDRLLLFSTAYSLESAYELFRVAGIMRLPEPELDRSLAVIPLAAAQDFYVYGNRLSEVAILASDPDRVANLRDALDNGIDGAAEVHVWQETMPELHQLIFLDDAGLYIMLVILIVVVGFGILNTVLMAVLERRHEFGVVLALGLPPSSVFRIVYMESLILAATGLVIGLTLAIPLVLYFQAHPIHLALETARVMELFGIEPLMTWKLKPLNPIGSCITVFGVAILAALYPALQASRGHPVDVLRGLP